MLTSLLLFVPRRASPPEFRGPIRYPAWSLRTPRSRRISYRRRHWRARSGSRCARSGHTPPWPRASRGLLAAVWPQSTPRCALLVFPDRRQADAGRFAKSGETGREQKPSPARGGPGGRKHVTTATHRAGPAGDGFLVRRRCPLSLGRLRQLAAHPVHQLLNGHAAHVLPVAQAHGDGVCFGFPVAYDEHVRHLLKLRVANLGVHALA